MTSNDDKYNAYKHMHYTYLQFRHLLHVLCPTKYDGSFHVAQVMSRLVMTFPPSGSYSPEYELLLQDDDATSSLLRPLAWLSCRDIDTEYGKRVLIRSDTSPKWLYPRSSEHENG